MLAQPQLRGSAHGGRLVRALLTIALSAMSGCVGRSPEALPNIVLIVLDTTRADHLSVYGYERDTTPHLAAFAEEAIRFERAFATSTWTVASHASIRSWTPSPTCWVGRATRPSPSPTTPGSLASPSYLRASRRSTRCGAIARDPRAMGCRIRPIER